ASDFGNKSLSLWVKSASAGSAFPASRQPVQLFFPKLSSNWPGATGDATIDPNWYHYYLQQSPLASDATYTYDLELAACAPEQVGTQTRVTFAYTEDETFDPWIIADQEPFWPRIHACKALADFELLP